MLFSVVIPVWKRPRELELILANLQVQAQDLNELVEVILCDSLSGSEINAIVEKAKLKNSFLQILHLQTDNVVAKKRNMGIDHSQGDFLIFLDDDCVPSDDFLQECFTNTKIMSGAVVLCGEVRFLEEMVSESNYYRYRDSRHPKNVNIMENVSLNAWTFVSMNYMVSRKELLKSRVKYGEDFFGYGAEDHDYGYQLIECGFKIIQAKQKIWHYEFGGDIEKYCIKVFHGSRDGMANLQKTNSALFNSTPEKVKFIEIFFKEKGLTILFFYFLFFNRLFFSLILGLLKGTDTYSFLYSNFLFRYLILKSYVDGIVARSNGDKIHLLENWYK